MILTLIDPNPNTIFKTMMGIKTLRSLRRELILKIEILIADWRRIESLAPIGRKRIQIQNELSTQLILIKYLKKSCHSRYILAYPRLIPKCSFNPSVIIMIRKMKRTLASFNSGDTSIKSSLSSKSAPGSNPKS